MKWFKHDANASIDSKLQRIKLKYGMEGYGLYWYLLECIARTVESHNLTFELEEDAELIAAATGIHHERCEEMMRYMVQVRLFESSRGRIFCLKMADRTDEYTQKLLRNTQQNQALPECPDSVQTNSRQCPDKVPPNRIEENRTEQKIKDKPKSENKFSDEDMRFAQWVWNRIQDLDPSRPKPNLDKWADISRLMRERDKLTHYDMGQVFHWANNDSFWKTNILSMAKFREKYSDLKIKMANVPATKKSKTTSEQIDEVMGGNNGSMDKEYSGSEPKIINAAQIGFLPEG